MELTSYILDYALGEMGRRILDWASAFFRGRSTSGK